MVSEPTMKEIAEWLREAKRFSRGMRRNEEWDARAAQVEVMVPTNAQCRAELDKVMPPDFKDWWENSPQELPLVAALVIKNLRERAEAAESQFEAMGERRCGTCKAVVEHNGNYECWNNISPMYGRVVKSDFGCIHWKRKEG